MFRRVALYLLFAVGFGSGWQNALQQAVALTREGKYAEARRALRDSREPSDIGQRIAFHRLKAAVAAGLGEFREAAGEMRAALRLSPDDSNLLLAVAAAELKANMTVEAMNHARAAGESALGYALMGDIQEKSGDAGAAIEAYRKAVTLAPANEQYRVALAREMIQHQAFRPAIEFLNETRPAFPQSGNLLVLLGIAHYAAGDTAEALDFLMDATDVAPKVNAAYFCLARIALQTSAAPAGRAVRILCAWNATVCAAVQLRQAREIADDVMARRAIEQLKRAPAADSVAHCALGRAYEWKGELPAARRELELCAAQDSSPQNHYVLAVLYKRMGETSLARKSLALRQELLGKMSEQTATGLTALQTLTGSLSDRAQ